MADPDTQVALEKRPLVSADDSPPTASSAKPAESYVNRYPSITGCMLGAQGVDPASLRNPQPARLANGKPLLQDDITWYDAVRNGSDPAHDGEAVKVEVAYWVNKPDIALSNLGVTTWDPKTADYVYKGTDDLHIEPRTEIRRYGSFTNYEDNFGRGNHERMEDNLHYQTVTVSRSIQGESVRVPPEGLSPNIQKMRDSVQNCFRG